MISPLTTEELAGFQSSGTPFNSAGNTSSGSGIPTASFGSSLPSNTGLPNTSPSPAIAELAAQLTMLAQHSGLALTPAAAAATASFMALTSQGTGGLPGISSTSAVQNLSLAALGSPPSVIASGSSQSQFLHNPMLTNAGVDGAPSSCVLIVSNLNEEVSDYFV